MKVERMYYRFKERARALASRRNWAGADSTGLEKFIVLSAGLEKLFAVKFTFVKLDF